MSARGPARGIVESRQTESRAQLKTARLLLPHDGDCPEECLFGRHCILRIALEQNLAAQAIEESVAPALSCLACESERFIDPGEGSRCVDLRFDLGK
jgi:hypothetical protein